MAALRPGQAQTDPDIVHAHQIADRSAGRAVRQTDCGRTDPGTVTRRG